MDFLQSLAWRGLVQEVSDPEGIKQLTAGDSFYVGFDPTAPAFQLGNLVPLMAAVHLGRAGLHPIILFGGATGAIGDPSGKSAERPLLPREVLDRNIAAQRAKAEEILARCGVEAAFVNNYDWTREFTLIEFLRDVGKHFTVNYMLSKEVIRARLDGDGISYTEFSYMLLQAYDFLHLYRTRGCRLQMGGSDQWGNLTAGLELIRRKAQGEAFAFSLPLLCDSRGKKFGKTESGSLWLDAGMTSPYKLHQFFLNVSDQDVMRVLKIFTLLEPPQLDALAESLRQAPEKREAQRALADAVCALVHGEEAVRDARRGAEVLFGGSLEGLKPELLEEIFSDVPSRTLPREKLMRMNFAELLAECGAAPSRGEAKKLIKNGGAYLNQERVSDAALIPAQTLAPEQPLFVVRTGKKSYHLIRIAG